MKESAKVKRNAMTTHMTDIAVARDQMPLLLSHSQIASPPMIVLDEFKRRPSLVSSREICWMDTDAPFTDFL